MLEINESPISMFEAQRYPVKRYVIFKIDDGAVGDRFMSLDGDTKISALADMVMNGNGKTKIEIVFEVENNEHLVRRAGSCKIPCEIKTFCDGHVTFDINGTTHVFKNDLEANGFIYGLHASERWHEIVCSDGRF